METLTKNSKKIMRLEAQGKKIFLFLIFSMAVFMLFPSVSAGKESLGTFKQGQNVRIVQTCSDASFITISSIAYPNGSVAVSGVDMISAGNGEFYYNFADTSELGIYDVRGISDGCEKTFTFYFEITHTGTIVSQPQGLLSIGVIFSVMLIMLFFGWLSFKFIENDRTFGFGLFFLVMSLILSLYSLFLSYIFSRDYLFTSISNAQEKLFLGGLFSLTGMMFIAFTFLIVKVIKELKIKKTEKEYGEGYNTEKGVYNY